VVLLALAYAGLALMMMFFENRLVFHPAPADDWAPPPLAEIRDVSLQTADGETVHGWWLEEPGADRTLLYLHGNAGNLSHRGGSIVKLRRLLKTSVLIMDYPGYGKSTGQPTERGCYQAADAAYAWLTAEAKRDPRKLILYGGSLGGGIAVDLASRKDYQTLVLVKTFTTLPDVGAMQFRWLPVNWLMRNRFDNVTKLALCKRPVFIAHGDADTLVPIEFGRKLYDAACGQKEFFVMPGAGHNDPLPEEFFVRLNAFLDANP